MPGKQPIGTLRVASREDGRVEVVVDHDTAKKGIKHRPVDSWLRLDERLLLKAQQEGVSTIDGCEVRFELLNGGGAANITAEVDLRVASSAPDGLPEIHPPPGKEAAAPRAVDRPRAQTLEFIGSRFGDVPVQPERAPSPAGDFYNPYSFVPALPRKRLDGLLGDHEPLGHDRLDPNALSGRIQVTMRVHSPLLLPDHATRQSAPGQPVGKEHWIYSTKLDANGQPDVAAASVRGMLRVMVEAATNSRMGVFDGTDRLTRRMSTGEAVKAAARVTLAQDGAIEIHVMETALARVYDSRQRRNGPPHPKVTWHGGEGEMPAHGAAVWATFTPEDGRRRPSRVMELWPRNDDDNSPPKGARAGWFMRTGPGAESLNKQSEVVLIDDDKPPLRVKGRKLERLVADWRAVITSYLNAAGQAGAIPANGIHQQAGYEDLMGTLAKGPVSCRYVEGDPPVLLPAAIGRIAFGETPRSLLHESVWPAGSLQELSPADRMFGWVGDGKRRDGSYRGQVRVGPVTCRTPAGEAIRRFDVPVPLAILSSPKPQQARFYAAQDPSGTPLDHGLDLARAMATGGGLRGRKVYPHQQGTEQDFTSNEDQYRAAGNEQGSQNFSIDSWVQPGTEFTFDLDVINLNEAEAGALLWLLGLHSKDGPAYFRLGAGRPLGFGSISLTMREARLRSGDETAHALRALSDYTAPSQAPPLTEDRIAALQEQFISALWELLGTPPDEEPELLRSLRVALRGRDGSRPTHYPKLPEGDAIYEWFTANAQGGQFALPPLWDDKGLPSEP